MKALALIKILNSFKSRKQNRIIYPHFYVYAYVVFSIVPIRVYKAIMPENRF